jgi:hypothetical protein
MRKILVVLMLVCALGLFAQIPAGTKSVAVLTGSTSDFLEEDGDFAFDVDVYGGYFLMDGLEIDAILGIDSDEDVDLLTGETSMGFTLGLGAMYHLPFSPMLGAAFTYMTAFDGIMAVPIDAGLEIFLTSNNAVRVGGKFTLSLEENGSNTLNVVLGTVHYF